jgi:hypothetical protein
MVYCIDDILEDTSKDNEFMVEEGIESYLNDLFPNKDIAAVKITVPDKEKWVITGLSAKGFQEIEQDEPVNIIQWKEIILNFAMTLEFPMERKNI